MKPSTMELGGSDPFLVLDDANFEKALEWALWSRLLNCGQGCVCAKRFIVAESLYDRFLAGAQKALATTKIGNPMQKDTNLGPLASEKARDTLIDQVNRSVKAGATLVMGGKAVDGPGFFFEPAILTGIEKGNPAYSEEFFGPVFLMFKAKTEEEAIALANDSPFGLASTVFSEDKDRAARVAAEIDAGMVFINHPAWTAPDLPFGGAKHSGYGRELSQLGIQEFVNKKLIRTQDAASQAL
jgi:succinate-semialdehyde dehydrogenase/glutarate-semialdehyde dehydrogenase